jgi:RNA polymerase sporulation-specific sigma factor
MGDNAFLCESDLHELIVRAQSGDREAFARVIDQVQPFVYKLARQYARRSVTAPLEDLVQVGLLAAVKSVPCFNTQAGVKFISYVGVAARRAIHRMAFGWKPLPQAASEEGDLIRDLADARDPGMPATDLETEAEVRKLIANHLGDRERRLIGQRFGLDGADPQTFAELALVTGTSRQNVQQVVERALRRLRNAIDARNV